MNEDDTRDSKGENHFKVVPITPEIYTHQADPCNLP
jgi:hypothetical protein